MSESDAREEESLRMAVSSNQIRHALSFAATTPSKVLSFRWEELRSFVPHIGEFNRSNYVRYLCAEHRMLDVDVGKLDQYQIADLIQADAEKHKDRKDNSNPMKRQAETLPGGDNAGGGQGEADRKQVKGKRGRRNGSTASDVNQDQRIADAWAKGFGHYASQEELAKAFQISKPDVVAALDRHRKRLGKSETIRPSARRQGQ